MSKKRRGKSTSQSAPPTPEEASSKRPAPDAGARSMRETVESIAIAFILAFLFRTFEAEAFVIPTGSMAPTLQGRHKDIDCPKCGVRYRASASAEVEANDDPAAAFLGDQRPLADQIESEIVQTTCPLCRFPMSVDPRPTLEEQEDPLVVAGAQLPSYNGDRIIVGKFNYEFSDPKR
ncbi:MAG: S26 family signal peptidase, partial [Planctomycetales bacterium]|nr:S26 family signal peptidase [Planctomycetales bacterium]